MGDIAGNHVTDDCAARVNLLKGLLWREWIAHKRMMMSALAIWLVGGWVLLIFWHPGWILAFGVVYAWVAASAFGGA